MFLVITASQPPQSTEEVAVCVARKIVVTGLRSKDWSVRRVLVQGCSGSPWGLMGVEKASQRKISVWDEIQLTRLLRGLLRGRRGNRDASLRE